MMVSIWRVLTATISVEYFECLENKKKDLNQLEKTQLVFPTLHLKKKWSINKEKNKIIVIS